MTLCDSLVDCFIVMGCCCIMEHLPQHKCFYEPVRYMQHVAMVMWCSNWCSP